MVELEPVVLSEDKAALRSMIEAHFSYTGSRKAKKVLNEWDTIIAEICESDADRLQAGIAGTTSGLCETACST